MNASNNCKLVGRFTKSPSDSLKLLDNGNYSLQISIAVKCEVIDKDGEVYERMSYPQLTFWNERAETIACAFFKGDLVEITAQVQTRRFPGKDQNSWRYTTEFLVDSVKLISSARPESQSPKAGSKPAKAPAKPSRTRRAKAI